MPPGWKVSPEYLAWISSLRQMEDPETCMAYSLCNAARMAGRTLHPKVLLDLWSKRGLCIPGSTPVVHAERALGVAESVLRDAGLQVQLTAKASASAFPSTFAHDPTTNCNPAHVITLGPGYMKKYHDTLGQRIPKRDLRDAFDGPGHDVMVLGMEGTDLLIHDPDPQLRSDVTDPTFDGAPVVRLDRARYRNYFASGDHARTLTAISQHVIKPKDKRAARRKGQRTLQTGDE